MCNILIGCAQNNDALTESLKLLQKPPEFEFPIDSTGFSKIVTPQFDLANGHSNMFIINTKNIHFIDFNNDGNKDIIYQDTQHYQTTMLFVNEDNTFIETWSSPGKLMEVKQGEETTIYVLKSAIGCDTNSVLMELSIHSDNTITESLISHHYKTAITSMDAIFEQKKISGILRTQPVLNNQEKKDPCTGDLKNGNQVRTIENKAVTVIKKQKDWLLVIYKEKDRSIISWIKN
ncbi:hypothetical protein ATE84_3474 [Aquimarina sp. MAR_2010_214]|uniref:hypothetical protein n=1 Tax=Aquimarina sp. MAR_2010_214 TaxID=1250026 RepID=UPI000CBA6C4D|nr:hypothetical protein [Aquimarina sp. MAR_2010_214]PKV51389.1 hypothetical protein ATE84_3474 [Aquimarina sp. MAR_2010_214]